MLNQPPDSMRLDVQKVLKFLIVLMLTALLRPGRAAAQQAGLKQGKVACQSTILEHCLGTTTLS
jgi:hypothetical protein